MTTQAIDISIRKASLRERLDLGNGLTPYFLVLPVVFVTIIGLFLPILISLWLSFLNRPPGTSGVEFIGLSNYVQLVTNSQFPSSLSTPLIFTLGAVTPENIFG